MTDEENWHPIPMYIPSRGRYTQSEIQRSTMMEFSPGTPINLVVWPEEAEQYTKAIENEPLLFATEVLVLPADVPKGIASKRKYIGEIAASRKEDRFMLMDDDIGFLVRRSADDWRLRATTHLETRDMMRAIDAYLNVYAAVGVSAREGNNRFGVGDVDALVVPNTRMMRAYAFQTELFNAVEHCRVDVMEDFDVFLQLLRQGYDIALLAYYAQGQSMTNAPGGCSVWRTHELHEQSAHKLAALHEGFVRTRQKQNKTDAGGFGTRTEVTVSWKKAAEAGKLAFPDRGA